MSGFENNWILTSFPRPALRLTFLIALGLGYFLKFSVSAEEGPTTNRTSPSVGPAKAPTAASLAARGFELSGLAAVDGGMLVADDELVGAVLFVADPAGPKRLAELVKIERKRTESEPFTRVPRLSAVQDFEGIASDGKKSVFLIGSHNGKDGDRRPDREFLFEAKWDAAQRELRLQRETRALAPQLDEALKKLGISIGLTATKIDEKVNIEGLAYFEGKLYIGLRGPLTAKREALVFRAEADGLFETGNRTVLEAFVIPLEGAGVRSMEWDPVTKKMLIVSGPATDVVDAESAVWAFSPESRALSLIHKFTREELQQGLKGRTAEGVCRGSTGKIVVVFDGSEEGSPNLLLLDWP